MGTASLFRG